MRTLIPRPLPPLVFNGFQYANTEGEGLGDLVMCNDVRVKVHVDTGLSCYIEQTSWLSVPSVPNDDLY